MSADALGHGQWSCTGPPGGFHPAQAVSDGERCPVCWGPGPDGEMVVDGDLVAGSIATAELGPAPKLGELRRHLLFHLQAAIAGTPADVATVVPNDVRDLAAALESIDQVAGRERVAAPAQPPFDLAALAKDVWAATQDAGGSTAIGDAAVAVIREWAAFTQGGMTP